MTKKSRAERMAEIIRDYGLESVDTEKTKQLNNGNKDLNEREKMIQLLLKFNIPLITLNPNPDVEFSREYYLNACINLGGDFNDFIKRIHEQCNLITDRLNSQYGSFIFDYERQMLNDARKIYLNIGLFLKHYMTQNGIKPNF